jgi:hypothetical protein
MKLKNTLRHIMGEDLITHLGLGILRLSKVTSEGARLQPCRYSPITEPGFSP